MTSDLTTGLSSLSVAIFWGTGDSPHALDSLPRFPVSVTSSRILPSEVGFRSKEGGGHLVRGTEAVRLPGGLGKGKGKHRPSLSSRLGWGRLYQSEGTGQDGLVITVHRVHVPTFMLIPPYPPLPPPSVKVFGFQFDVHCCRKDLFALVRYESVLSRRSVFSFGCL